MAEGTMRNPPRNQGGNPGATMTRAVQPGRYEDTTAAPQGGMTLQQLLDMGGAAYDPSAYYDSEAGGSMPWQPSPGPGWMQGFGALPGQNFYDNSTHMQLSGNTFDTAAFNEYLRANGYTVAEANPGQNRSIRGIFDRQGNPVVPVEQGVYEDQRFWNGAMAAMAVTGANVAAAGGAGGAASAASGGNVGTTAGASSMPSVAAAQPAISTAGMGAVTAPTVAGAGATAGTAGVMGMNAGNWIQLANLGAGLYASDRAGDRAEAALAGAEGAAAAQTQLSRDQFDWFTNFVESQQPARDAAEQRANDVSDAQLEAMRFATEQARDLDAYNRSTFRPIEQRLAADAVAYDTPGRRAGAAASAAADVDMSAAATQQANDRALARSGIAPGSMRAMALREDAAIGQSAARGGAMTQAVRGVEGQGYARMMDAAGLGRGVVGNQATQQNIATSTGNSSVGNAMQGLAPGQMAAGNMQTAFGNSINANNAAGNLYGQAARAANDENALLLQGMSGLGRWAGSTFGGT